jgi:hypothetical protein
MSSSPRLEGNCYESAGLSLPFVDLELLDKYDMAFSI